MRIAIKCLTNRQERPLTKTFLPSRRISAPDRVEPPACSRQLNNYSSYGQFRGPCGVHIMSASCIGPPPQQKEDQTSL